MDKKPKQVEPYTEEELFNIPLDGELDIQRALATLELLLEIEDGK